MISNVGDRKAPVPQAAKDPAAPLVLEVKSLVTHFPVRGGVVRAVDDVSFTLRRGHTLCVVGESGSGKSVTARSILKIVDPPGRIMSGSVILHRNDGTNIDLATLPERSAEMRKVRGREIAMIFQEPMSSLSPVHTIGDQIMEVLRLHMGLDRRSARARVCDLLARVEIPNPATAIDRFTFEFSGGMRQRVMIAMALACDPAVLIADEPTTALDVTTQAEILELMAELQRERGMAVLFITHDMGVVAEIADDVLVMNQGKLVEGGSVDAVFHHPVKDYTQMLIGSVRRLEQPAAARVARPEETVTDPPVLQLRNLALHFPQGRRFLGGYRSVLKAVDGVSLELGRGETLGIVGESGSGKTTVGRCILRVYTPTHGNILYQRADGSVVDLAQLSNRNLAVMRREIRMIFQDPFASLNPRMTVAQIIGEPLLVNGLNQGQELDERVVGLMRQVGLKPEWRERYPHAFSGGQRQRIGIARAIALKPRVIVADEATSALDVSLRSQMLDLLIDLQDQLRLSYLFISHDISVIRYICDRVAVMYRGRVVEVGTTQQVCEDPQHDYTKALLSAVPRADPRARRIHQRFRHTT